MSCRTTQIVIGFRQPPLELFAADNSQAQREANRLVIQIQPAEGIQLHFHTKVPGDGMRLRLTDLEFSYSREFSGRLPEAYEPLLLDCMTGDASLFARSDEVEKSWEIIDPFVRAWNNYIHTVFDESQVYRIDHYLGKESVQNILALRFANTIFEPIWNRRYIDHVQITVAEEVPVGRRGGYYDSAGVLRDMFQNHLLQLLMVTAMEAPVHFNANAVRNEKVKVLDAIRPLTLQQVASASIRGQYSGYLEEPGVRPASNTATFGAVRLSRQLEMARSSLLFKKWKGNELPNDTNCHWFSTAATRTLCG
jgi:glucose-6-phosphate 1-dehydrogenase